MVPVNGWEISFLLTYIFLVFSPKAWDFPLQQQGILTMCSFFSPWPHVRACLRCQSDHFPICRCRRQKVPFQLLRMVCFRESWGRCRCWCALSIITSEFVPWSDHRSRRCCSFSPGTWFNPHSHPWARLSWQLAVQVEISPHPLNWALPSSKLHVDKGHQLQSPTQWKDLNVLFCFFF